MDEYVIINGQIVISSGSLCQPSAVAEGGGSSFREYMPHICAFIEQRQSAPITTQVYRSDKPLTSFVGLEPIAEIHGGGAIEDALAAVTAIELFLREE